ncbi:hypothetical protein GOBAR_AA22963 [Gossypium barbadense]|uniref:AB hydrolase-1 domain-containing protein n=1 Tax=Gossypium barbadense TaxID=3634 RepID=A0A2P5X2Z1_GOSBA|nr:hypothetical protein GOBAR_AA22963 [Gossypium barbadense]
MAIVLSIQHLPKMTLNPIAVLNEPRKTRVPYELKQGQSRVFHQLPSGLNMEVIVQKSVKEKNPESRKDPPLVFVHGSYHSAWCWAEHWLPFFSNSGFDCFALSLLGQGESDTPSGTVAGSLQMCEFSTIYNRFRADADINSAALICSVPPSGNSGLVWRYLFSKPIAAFKVTRSLAAKAFQTSLSLCRETFFSATMEDNLARMLQKNNESEQHSLIEGYKSSYQNNISHLLRKSYQELMKESSRVPLFDLRKLNESLPVPKMTACSTEILVLGAKDDFIVDAEGLNETGRFYNVTPICIEGVAHDMMLDCSWGEGANVILSWLNGLNR